MYRNPLTFAAACLIASCAPVPAPAAPREDALDPRLREVHYDPQTVVTVLVKRGVVTDVVLDPGEAITDVASGLGADCAKPESSWCIAAQPGGRHLFVKPKSTASVPNNIAVVTDRRSHSFRFVVLSDQDRRQPVYRLSVRMAEPATARAALESPTMAAALVEPTPPSPAELIRDRLATAPQPVNSSYSIAEGKASDDIVPSLVFDDGRFTYLRFANNREVPAVFAVLPNDAETVVNARMEGDLLVVDRVGRRLMLRAGSAVVEVFNDAFDLDGVPPANGTTVSGVDRAFREAGTRSLNHRGGVR